MGKKRSKKESFNFKNWIFINLFWILIVLGIFMLYLSSLGEKESYYQNILEKAGLAVLSSGVFAGVLKSFQFAGLFKKEIEKIMLGTKFIQNRNDLPELWKKISKSVYDKKFPKISDELNEIILNSYFPIRHKYYYEDFRYTLTIDELTDDNIIKFTQVVRYRVVLAKGETEAKLESIFRLEKIPGFEHLVNKRIYYKVDGIDCDPHDENIENDFEKIIKTTLLVKNKKEFIVERKERKEYCIKEDNYKLLRVNSITKEMDVSITYPKNMLVSFFNVGLVNNFERKHTDHERTISRVHKTGLILPNQGFGISFGIQ